MRTRHQYTMPDSNKSLNFLVNKFDLILHTLKRGSSKLVSLNSHNVKEILENFLRKVLAYQMGGYLRVMQQHHYLNRQTIYFLKKRDSTN